jgi:WD40 repeat protein
LLDTPIEVTTIEWHPDNSNVLVGGCLNGQIIIWDLSAKDYMINSGKKQSSEESDAIGDDKA